MAGIVLAAAYMLWMLQRVVLGPASSRTVEHLPDLNAREMATLIPLVILVFLVGVYPGPLMELLDVSVTNLLEQSKVDIP
jgi:NADH-quinone oxidoreductase subunit M